MQLFDAFALNVGLVGLQLRLGYLGGQRRIDISADAVKMIYINPQEPEVKLRDVTGENTLREERTVRFMEIVVCTVPIRQRPSPFFNPFALTSRSTFAR